MSISYKKFAYADTDNFLMALQEAIQNSGMYDTVTIDSSAKKLTASNGGKVYFEFIGVGNSSSVTISVYSDTKSTAMKTVSYLSNTYIAVASVGSAVVLTIVGGWRCSTILTKSTGGKNMIVTVDVSNNSWQPIIIPNDASSIYQNSANNYGIPFKDDALNCATTASIIAQSSSEGYAVSKNVYHFKIMPTSIAYPWTNNATNNLTQIQIGDTMCLTDGYFVVADDS